MLTELCPRCARAVIAKRDGTLAEVAPARTTIGETITLRDGSTVVGLVPIDVRHGHRCGVPLRKTRGSRPAACATRSQVPPSMELRKEPGAAVTARARDHRKGNSR